MYPTCLCHFVAALMLLSPLALDATSLDVRLHPPEGELQPLAEILLLSPTDKKTGWDPETGREIEEVPGSHAAQESLSDDETGAPGPITLVVYVPDPIAGEYELWVIGRKSGGYLLEIQAVGNPPEVSRHEISNSDLQPGEIDHFMLVYSPSEPLILTRGTRSRFP